MASSYGTDASKSSLRSNYLEVRRKIPARSRAVADADIRRSLAGFALFCEAPLVLAYVSYGAEVDTRALIEELLAQGTGVAVPRCRRGKAHAGEMDFCRIGSLDELAPGAHGLMEPAPDVPALTVPELAGSVCLVPGLVFDAQGYRVGYGGGYYDRFLPFYPGDKIGLARTGMISSNPLPHDATDVPVDFIATESGIWTCR